MCTQPQDSSHTTSPWTTLVVDDESGVREMIGTILRRRGHTVLLAANGQEAWEIFQREKPHIVITDIMMPVMNGIELLQRIREVEPHAEVVLITAFARTELVVQALRNGANNFLEKPFRTIDLMTHLQESQHRLEVQHENTRLRELLAEHDAPTSHAAVKDRLLAARARLEQLHSEMMVDLSDHQTETLSHIVAELDAVAATWPHQ